MLRLKLQYHGRKMQRDDSLERKKKKKLMLGKFEGKRRRGSRQTLGDNEGQESLV